MLYGSAKPYPCSPLRIRHCSTCRSYSALPVDQAVANLIATLDGKGMLALSSTPSDQESTMHLDVIIHGLKKTNVPLPT